jgi:hypothetical protein
VYDLDLYADENEPEVGFVHKTYRVKVPMKRSMELPTNWLPFVYVEVDEYGMINIDRNHTMWFGDRLTQVDASKSVSQMYKEIYGWLVEWELARWIPIGPEDSELFATKKLTGETYEYEHA